MFAQYILTLQQSQLGYQRNLFTNVFDNGVVLIEYVQQKRQGNICHLTQQLASVATRVGFAVIMLQCEFAKLIAAKRIVDVRKQKSKL